MQKSDGLKKNYYLDKCLSERQGSCRRGSGARRTGMKDTGFSPIEPAHVRAGPTHPDPYPYYARLAAEQPLFRDETRGVWVAAGASAVNAVLTSDLCRTRPLRGPIPEMIRGGAMAKIFGRLVRLRDDEARHVLKAAIVAALGRLDLSTVAALAEAHAAELGAKLEPQRGGEQLTRFMFGLPGQVMADLMGVPASQHENVGSWLGDYGAATAAAATGVPTPSQALMERGHEAARALFALFGALRNEQPRAPTLLHLLADEAERGGCKDADAVTANAIGLLFQGYGATASLIGLTLLALARRPAVCASVEEDRTLLSAVIQEVLRCDPSTQSTLRFVARDGVVAGAPMREGDTIIVALAAASHDPTLNRDPDCFDPARADRRYFEFGRGAHACPGDKLAPLIAEVGVDHLLRSGVALETLEGALTYAASAHVRTPLFSH
jgi:cytochrome P450